MTIAEGPNRPEPQPVNIDRTTTAVAALDLGNRFGPEQAPWLEKVSAFLDQARASSVPIIYSLSLTDRGTPRGEVVPTLKRRETEPVIFPNAFDKFISGELHAFLSERGIHNLIIVGSATNFAVLYTVTTAARVHRYNVVLPLDGVMARNKYEHEYALHQMTVLPAGAAEHIQFTTLAMITFHQK